MRNKGIFLTGIMAMACAGAMPAWAQMQPQARQQSGADSRGAKILSEMRELEERARTIREQLNESIQKAQELNPDLLELQNELMDLFEKKLDEYGYPSEAKLNELRGIQQRLQSPEASDMPEAERQQLTEQFNAGVAKLQQAQEKAQNDSQVIATQEEFEQVRSESMRKVDPQASDLQKELEEIQPKIETLRAKLQRVMQSPAQ